MSRAQVANALNCSTSSVDNWTGVRSNFKSVRIYKTKRPANLDRYRELLIAGRISRRQMARECGCTVESTYVWLPVSVVGRADQTGKPKIRGVDRFNRQVKFTAELWRKWLASRAEIDSMVKVTLESSYNK